MEAGQYLEILQNTQSPDNEIRTNAEQAIQSLQNQPQYALRLSEIALATQVQTAMRQLACVLLKNHVMNKWESGVVSEQEKSEIKAGILNGLAEESTKIRTGISMVITEIAAKDYPNTWPSLLEDLINMFTQAPSPDHPQTSGALRCLTFVTEKTGFEASQLMQVLPVLMPRLHSIVSEEQFSGSVRSQALNLTGTLFRQLSKYASESRASSGPEMIKEFMQIAEKWMELICPMVSTPCTQFPHPSVKLEALKIMQLMVTSTRRSITQIAPQFFESLWQCMVVEGQVFNELVVSGGSSEDEVYVYDADGREVGPYAVAAQTLELVISVLLNAMDHDEVVTHVDAITYHVTSFLLLTNHHLVLWQDDPNTFLAEEDEESLKWSVRSFACDAITNIQDAYSDAGVAAVVKAAQKRMTEAGEKYNADPSDSIWWKLREVSLQCICLVAEELAVNISHEESVPMDVFGLLNSVLTTDIPGSFPPPLKARALWLGAQFVDILDRQGPEFTQAALHILNNSDSDMCLQLFAIKSLAKLIESIDPGDLINVAPHIVAGIVRLLPECNEDTAGLCLEGLNTVIKECPQSVDRLPQDIDVVNILLGVWHKYSNDLFVAPDIVDAFEVLLRSERGSINVYQQVLPVVQDILQSNPDNKAPGLLESSLDILTVIVAECQRDNISALIQQFFPVLRNVLLNTDDPSVIENGAECLQAFVCVAHEPLLEMHKHAQQSESDSPLQFVLDFLSFALNPELEESSACYIGGLAAEFILRLGDHFSSVLPDIFDAMIVRMAGPVTPSLVESMVFVFARIVNSSDEMATNIVDFLARRNVPGEDNLNALAFLLNVWAYNQEHFLTDYRKKVTLHALAKLAFMDDKRINSIQVAHRIHSNKDTRIPFTLAVAYYLARTVCGIVRQEELMKTRVSKAYGRIEGENDDDEEWQDDDDDDDLNDLDAAEYDYYSELIDLEAADAESEPIMNKFEKEDPIYTLDLKEFGSNTLKNLVSNTDVHQGLSHLLSDSQQKALYQQLSN